MLVHVPRGHPSLLKVFGGVGRWPRLLRIDSRLRVTRQLSVLRATLITTDGYFAQSNKDGEQGKEALKKLFVLYPRSHKLIFVKSRSCSRVGASGCVRAHSLRISRD